MVYVGNYLFTCRRFRIAAWILTHENHLPQQRSQDMTHSDIIEEYRQQLATNLQNAIEAITGKEFSDDDALVLANEVMVKYNLPPEREPSA